MPRRNAPNASVNPKKLETQEREQQVLALKRRGVTYDQIGQALGISMVGAYKIVQRVYERVHKEMKEEAREQIQIQMDRLDLALMAISRQVEQGHLGAVDRWIRILESQRKLLGLDKPQKISVTSPDGDTDSLSPIAEGLAAKVADLAARYALPEPPPHPDVAVSA